jgi:hypothetical protein
LTESPRASPERTLDRNRAVRDLIVPALLASVVVATIICALTVRDGNGIVSLATPGVRGSAAAIFRADFPHAHLASDSGHDGQQFYVIARQPMHLRAAADGLDRPRYRLQRILLPALGWMTAPQGGGRALIISLYFWATVGVALVGFGGGALVRLLGGTDEAARRTALLLPIVPGVLASLALLGPDALALGLALVAIGFDLRDRRGWAIATAVLAVLAKEPLLLVLAGYAIARGRRAVLMFVVPAAVAFGWWLVLRATVPVTAREIKEFEPFLGIGRAIAHWTTTGEDLAAAAMVLLAVALGGLALVRGGWRTLLAPAIALQLAFLVLLSADVIGLNWNATRATAPLIVLAIVSLASGLSRPRGAPA